MARLLYNGEWFDSVSAESLFEHDFEDIILDQAKHLYPDFVASRFKKLVESEYGAARADLALIDIEYRSWWVVEVELSSHSLRRHVEQQVARLATAAYGPAEADHLKAQNESLEVESLTEMMRGRQPRVFVVVNEAKPDWSVALARWNAVVGVAEIFRSRVGGPIVLRINGEQPSQVAGVVSLCRVDQLMPTFLRIDSPAGLPAQDEHLQLWFAGSLTEWRRLESGSTVWLVPARRYPLPQGIRVFALLREAAGRLILEPRQSSGGMA